MIQERCKTLLDVVAQSRWYFCPVSDYDPAAVKKWVKAGTGEILSTLIDKLAGVSDWTAENIQNCVQQTVDAHEVGFAKVAQPVRIAVTGGTNSPSIDATLAILGYEETLKRLRAGLAAFV